MVNQIMFSIAFLILFNLYRSEWDAGNVTASLFITIW